MFNLLICLSAGVGVGSSVSFLAHYLLKRQKLNQTKQKAQHIVQLAKESIDREWEQALNRVEEYKIACSKNLEQEIENLSLKKHTLQTETEHLAQQKEDNFRGFKKQSAIFVQDLNSLLKDQVKKENQLKTIKKELDSTREQVLVVLEKKAKIGKEILKQEEKKQWTLQIKEQMLQETKDQEEHFKHSVNQQAEFLLQLALSRFQQAYCPQRGIENITFASLRAMERAFGGPDFKALKWVEKECGVDIKINDKDFNVSVLGIDPVRRELGRMVLQKVKSYSRIKIDNVKSITQTCKKDLFSKIKNDGQRICRTLNLYGIKPEVKNMMGALRYRYSFAQNQHFHCQEVAWLCGLLSAEMGMPVEVARRAGMLHDIGKAMDHSKEGGHAVIGADFIKQHGESEEVVQAVRAHHHDVVPDNPLDFLVISADALSGARPGARRSTVDSYNQKVMTLEKIGRSFEGVKDTYIMSAGREIRVIVDSYKIDDTKALELSKKIAEKIEEDCSYPGLIKVTVVRTVIKNAHIQSRHRRLA